MCERPPARRRAQRRPRPRRTAQARLGGADESLGRLWKYTPAPRAAPARKMHVCWVSGSSDARFEEALKYCGSVRGSAKISPELRRQALDLTEMPPRETSAFGWKDDFNKRLLLRGETRTDDIDSYADAARYTACRTLPRPELNCFVLMAGVARPPSAHHFAS